MLQDPVNQALQNIRVGCSTAFPLAVDFDEHDIVGADDAGGATPRMVAVGAVKLQAAGCSKIEQGVDSHVAKPTVVNRAFIHHEDR